MKVVDSVISWMGLRREPAHRQSVVDLLREREALAEQQAEAALNGMRAVRLEYDPRCRGTRQKRLDSIHSRIEEQQASIAKLKEGLARG